jgi:AsmA family
MNTGLKIVGIVVAVLVVLVIGIVVFFVMNSNAIVKRAIEAVGTEELGVPVNVARVNLSLREGRATIDGLTIGNPPGFDSKPALQIQSFTVALDMPASSQNLFVIDRIAVAGASVAAQVSAEGKTNFSTIMQNLESPSGESTSSAAGNIKLIVRHFDFTGASATATAPLLKKPVEFSIRDIHVNDVGKAEGGVSPSALGQALLRPVVAAVVSELRNVGVAGLRKSLESKVNDSLNQQLKGGLQQLQQLGHPSN